MSEEKQQSSFHIKVHAKYWTRFVDTPLEEAQRKTIALVEFAKSIGLVIELESTYVASRYPTNIPKESTHA